MTCPLTGEKAALRPSSRSFVQVQRHFVAIFLSFPPGLPFRSARITDPGVDKVTIDTPSRQPGGIHPWQNLMVLIAKMGGLVTVLHFPRHFASPPVKHSRQPYESLTLWSSAKKAMLS